MITIDYPSQKLLPQVDEAIRFVRDEYEVIKRSYQLSSDKEDARIAALTGLAKIKYWWLGRDYSCESIDGHSIIYHHRISQERLDVLYRVKKCCEHAEVVRLDGDILNLITYLCGK